MDGVTSLITSALSNVTTVFNAGVDMVTGNEIAMVFIGFSLVGTAVGFFKGLTSRG